MAIQHSETCQLCKTGCGFLGDQNTRNLCSVCYSIVLKKETPEPTILAVNVADKNPLKDHRGVIRKTVNRCRVCNKRVGLIGFGCRCGRTFCGLHRMPEEHACDFDFKAAARVLLEEQNPVCVADKLERRI